MSVHRYARTVLRDGTREDVEFGGRTVGVVGTSRHGDETVFVWGQSPLRMESDWRGEAYSMSVPLLEELEDRGVDTVYVTDAEKRFELSKFRTADDNRIERNDERFEEPQEYDQLFVRVETF